MPDSILLKPNALTADEARIMDQHRQLGVEILRSSCSSPAILEIVGGYAAWYDGTNLRAPLKGEAIPLGARMLSICDAFDAMVLRANGQNFEPRDTVYPNVYDGVEGMFFIQQCVTSSERNGAWLPMKHEACRR